MTREEIYGEMKEMLGLVPSFFKTIPDSSLELEWDLFKRIQVDEGPISHKNRELIGLAISAATKCRYCAFFHTEMAKAQGATDAEIQNAIHYAKSAAGWSTYLNGMQTDFEEFKKEVLQVSEHIRANQARKAA